MLAAIDAPKNVLALQPSGPLTRDDVKAMRTKVEEVLDARERTGLVVDLTRLDITNTTLGAVMEDARFEMEMLSKLARFPRIAIVSDAGWMARMAGVADRLTPPSALRVFGADEREAATAWAADLAAIDTKDEPSGAVKLLDTPRVDFLAYEIEGRITADAIAPLVAAFDKAVAGRERIDLLVRLKDFDGFDLGLLADADLRRLKMQGVLKVRRYAVVGAPDWMERLAAMVGHLMPLTIRTFDEDEEDRAWAWLAREA